MEEIEKLTISDPILEQLRCSGCNGYLSCSPIQLLSNGDSICGRCSPSGDDGPTFRQFAFEAILSQILFPCRYETEGCTERLYFGQGNEHEAKCIYQNKFCPINASTCTWKGSWPQVVNHISENHSEDVMKKPIFTIDIGKFSSEIFMVENMGVSFMVCYKYNQKGTKLDYVIQYLPSFRNPQDEYLKIRLTNVSDRTFSYTFSGGKCVPLNINFLEGELQFLNLSNYLEILNHPKKIEFEINFEISRDLDCKLLESLKCKGCHGYLIPPIFDCDQGIICYDCFDDYSNCKSSINEELKEVIANTNYPCRWYGCDFVDKSVNIRKHELDCRFCVYQCPGSNPSTSTVFIENCDKSFKGIEAVGHFERHLHKFQFFGGDEFNYNFSLGKTNAHQKFSIFTLKYGRVILIQGSSGSDHHTIAVRVSEGSRLPNGQKMHFHPIRCSLQFKHPHCKSKVFTISDGRIFRIDDFPPCFNYDECFCVTLKLFQEIISI